MFGEKPAVKILLPYCAGIILAFLTDIPFGTVFVISVLLLLLYRLSVTILPAPGRIIPWILLISLGFVKYGYDAKLRTQDDAEIIRNIGRPVTVVGSVVDLPRVGLRSTRFVLRARTILSDSLERDLSADLYVTLLNSDCPESTLNQLNYGARLRLSGELTPVGSARNPGEFDLEFYLSLLEIHARFYPEPLNDSCFIGTEKNGFEEIFVYPVRRMITEKIDRIMGGEEGKFLKWLIVGERSEITPEVKTAFINTGVMHILAVSGLHVAVVLVILISLFSLVRIPEKISLIAISLILVYYNYLTGNTPSVTRSVIMALVYLGGRLLGERVNIYNTLSVSALVLLLIDSKQLFHPGFQLSFVAVFSIIYLYPKLAMLKKYLPGKLASGKIFNFVFTSGAVTLAAGAGTLPFTSIYFGKISVISFVANLIIVPLSNLILAAGMTAVAFSFVSEWVGSVYGGVTKLLTEVMIRAVEWFGSLPYAFSGFRFRTIDAFYFYAFLLVASNLPERRFRGRLAIGFLLLLNALLCAGLPDDFKNPVLRITFLDVGQGDSIFIEYPDGKKMLVDAGPKTFGLDAGARFVLPFLAYKNVATVDRVVITHPDADHLGGLPSILRGINVLHVIQPDISSRSEIFREANRLIDSIGIHRSYGLMGDLLDSNRAYRSYLIWPMKSPFREGKINNGSIIIRIVYGRSAVLLMGDAEKEADERIAEVFGPWLRSDLLKISHHGSNTGTSVRLLDEVTPSFGIISVGRRNYFGHPSPEVLERLAGRKVDTRRTDLDGAIVLESDGERWTFKAWR